MKLIVTEGETEVMEHGIESPIAEIAMEKMTFAGRISLDENNAFDCKTGESTNAIAKEAIASVSI